MPIIQNNRLISSGFILNRQSLHANRLRLWFPASGSLVNFPEYINKIAPTYTGDPGIVPDALLGRAIASDGTLDRISYGDTDKASFLSTGMSIALWLQRNNTSRTESVVSKYQNSHREYMMGFSGTDMWCLLWDNTNGGYIGRRFNYTAFSDSAWHHVVWTYDGGTAQSGVKIFVNGVQSDTTDIGTGTYVSMNNTSSEFELLRAQAWSGNVLDGKLTDVRLYERVLSSAEVQHQYHNPFDLYAPSVPMFVVAPAVGSGGLSIPLAMANYRIRRIGNNS